MPNEHLVFSKDSIHLPLSAYDVLGYLAPGCALLGTLFTFDFYATDLRMRMLKSGSGYAVIPSIHTPTYKAYVLWRQALMGDSYTWPEAALLMLVLVCCGYIAGHLVASLSALCLDRILIKKGYSYPFHTLLGISDQASEEAVSRSFYKGLFFWVNAALLCLACYVLVGASGAHVSALRVLCCASFIMFGVVTVATIAKIAMSARRQLQRTRESVGLKRAFAMFAAPYELLSGFMSKFIDSRFCFNAEFVATYKKAFLTAFSMEADKADSNNYWLPYLYVLSRRSGALAGVQQNWLHLYSFARNLATAFYLSFIYSTFWLLTHWAFMRIPSGTSRVALGATPLFTFLVAIVMLNRYYYLYFHYYSKNMFRAFVLSAGMPDDRV